MIKFFIAIDKYFLPFCNPIISACRYLILHKTYKPPNIIELEKKSPTLIQMRLEWKSRREERRREGGKP